MISLKRYIESNRDELLRCTLESYRASIGATSEFGTETCPPIAGDFQQGLANLQQRLSGDVTPSLVSDTQHEIEQQLKSWGDRAAAYFRQKAAEVKDLMMVLACTAESVGARDQHYAHEFADFSAQLRSIADLEDLTKIRASLVQSAAELKTCVEKMTQDSRQSVAQLRAQLSTYQARLEESERQATRDALTGLDNRRRIELEIELRIRQGHQFCMLLFDLNQFKRINDDLGHTAGDELLKQFATELKAGFRPVDVVGRWGGDEFVVLLDCTIQEAAARVERIRSWVFGEYTIQTGEGVRKVNVSAAVGMVASNDGETLAEILERADHAMYQDKRKKTR